MKKKLIYSTMIGVLTVAMGALVACQDEWPKTVTYLDDSILPDTVYTNPVFEPVLADPTLIRAADGTFYAYGTEDSWPETEGGGHHIVPIIMSKDLVNWTYVADAFTSESKPKWTANAGDGNVWAPQIRFEKGQYILYYSLSVWGDEANTGIGVATSTKPEGPFTDMGKVFSSQEIGVTNSIDPFFITVGSGRLEKSYMFWGSFRGIYYIEMSDYKTTKGTKVQIANDQFEGVYIYEHDGYFYFFGSSDACCSGDNSNYNVTVARSEKITGPYVNKAGQSISTPGVRGEDFLHGDKSYGWVGPGHNAEIITDDNGRDFILYHAIDVTNPWLNTGHTATRRPLMMDEITWVDGWPVINAGTQYVNMPSKTMKESPYFEEKK